MIDPTTAIRVAEEYEARLAELRRERDEAIEAKRLVMLMAEERAETVDMLRAERDEWAAAAQTVVDAFDPVHPKASPTLLSLTAAAAKLANTSLRRERDRLQDALWAMVKASEAFDVRLDWCPTQNETTDCGAPHCASRVAPYREEVEAMNEARRAALALLGDRK